MMHTFLSNNRDELIRRCKEKVARRPRRAATASQLRNGVPMFLDQLTKTLEADEAGEGAASERISGASGGVAPMLSEMSVTAAAHGHPARQWRLTPLLWLCRGANYHGAGTSNDGVQVQCPIGVSPTLLERPPRRGPLALGALVRANAIDAADFGRPWLE